MKISGKEITTEWTHKASRNLTTISAVVLMVKFYEVPLENLKILGVSAPAELFDTVAVVLLVYGAWSLIINWIGDLGIWRLWYADHKVKWYDNREETHAEYLDFNARDLKRWVEGEPDGDLETRLKEIERRVETIDDHLKDAGQKFTVIVWYGWFYVVGQMLILPIGLTISALIVLYLH